MLIYLVLPNHWNRPHRRWYVFPGGSGFTRTFFLFFILLEFNNFVMKIFIFNPELSLSSILYSIQQYYILHHRTNETMQITPEPKPLLFGTMSPVGRGTTCPISTYVELWKAFSHLSVLLIDDAAQSAPVWKLLSNLSTIPAGHGKSRRTRSTVIYLSRHADNFTVARPVRAQRWWRRGDGRPAFPDAVSPRRGDGRPSLMLQL